MNEKKMKPTQDMILCNIKCLIDGHLEIIISQLISLVITYAHYFAAYYAI